MVASEEQIQAAAEAMALGEALAREHWQAAAENPGVGLQVSLPSAPSPLGPVIGEGYDVAPTAPALRPVQRPQLVPDYAPEAVGGLAHHVTTPGVPSGLDGIPTWPSPSRSSSIVHISPRSRASEPAKVAKAEPGPIVAATAVATSKPTRPARAKTVRSRIRSARRAVLGK